MEIFNVHNLDNSSHSETILRGLIHFVGNNIFICLAKHTNAEITDAKCYSSELIKNLTFVSLYSDRFAWGESLNF